MVKAMVKNLRGQGGRIQGLFAVLLPMVQAHAFGIPRSFGWPMRSQSMPCFVSSLSGAGPLGRRNPFPGDAYPGANSRLPPSICRAFSMMTGEEKPAQDEKPKIKLGKRAPGKLPKKAAKLAAQREQVRERAKPNAKGAAGGDEDGLSNRAKFRQTPVDPKIVAKIREGHLCSEMGQAMRHAHRTNRDEIEQEKSYRGFSRPPMYRDLPPHLVEMIGTTRKDKLTFIAGALTMRSMPPEGLPEVCFCGRSNVGKSSIINAVTLSTTVRSSDKPGMTQQFNFYQLPKRLMLVDLPGYGFAFANEHKMEGWKVLMDSYNKERKVLKRAFVILDARHGIKQNDREFLNRLEFNKTPFQLVLTKCDLVREDDLARRHALIMEELQGYSKALKTIRMVSAYTGAGLVEFAQDLYSLSLKKPVVAERDDSMRQM